MAVPQWLDLSAVVVGAFAGVLVGHERKLDLVGFVAMCLICALGGGLLRDALMQVGEVYALESPYAVPLCVATALVGFLFPTLVMRHPNLYEWVDMVSVALFVVAGASKATAYDLHAHAVVLMGTITGVGGGMLRDVFLGDIPQVFRRSNFYALCAVVGSAAFYVGDRVLLLDQALTAALTVVIVVAMRRISLRYDLLSPAEVNLGPTVRSTGLRMARMMRERTQVPPRSEGESEPCAQPRPDGAAEPGGRESSD